MSLNIGLRKFKLAMMYIASLAITLGSVSFAVPQFFGQVAYATAPTATVSQTGNSTGGEIIYSFSEPVQLMNADKTAIIPASEYASSLGIYEYGDYSTHSPYQDDVTKVGTITSAVLNNDENKITIEYTGNLEGTTDMQYVVDAWGLNITDLSGNKMPQDASQIFEVKAEAPTMTKQAEISSKTITYTFSEPMQLVKQDDILENRVATDFSSDKLGIYAVTDGNYNLSTKADVAIDASLNNDKTVLSVTYTGNLEKKVNTQYVIDAWGYDITDLAGNVISKAELSKALFTVNAVPPTATVVHDETAKTITYNFSEPVQLRDEDGNVLNSSAYVSSLAVYDSATYLAHQPGQTEPAHAVAILSAVLSSDAMSIVINYDGSLIRNTGTSYIVDAWGKNITDLAGNKMAQDESQIFTVAGYIEQTFNDISNLLKAKNISNNLDEVTADNITSFDGADHSGLYFEKSVLIGQTMTKMGKITFTKPLDLSNTNTQTFLQNLGDELEMSSGYVALDARTATDLKTAGAFIEMYTLPQGLDLNQISLTVKDENDVVLGNVASDVNYRDLGGEVGGICTIFSFNAGHFTSFGANVVNDNQVTPTTNDVDGSGAATVNSTNSEVVLTNPDQAVTVTVASTAENPKIDVSAFVASGTGVLPEIKINSSVADVTLPDQTTVTGQSGWNGIINAPTSGTPIGGKAPAGFSVGGTVISVGSESGTLLFDKAVTIVLHGVTGTVGYRPSGSTVWYEITNICAGTYDNPTGAVYPGECAISNGTDTKILTFHFTSFGELLAVATPVVSTTPSTTISESETYYGDSAQADINSGSDSQAILGSQTTNDDNKDKAADSTANSTTNNGGSMFGLMWYWWLLIMAVIASAWWIIPAVRNRNS